MSEFIAELLDSLKKQGFSILLLVIAVVYLNSKIDRLEVDLKECHENLIHLLSGN